MARTVGLLKDTFNNWKEDDVTNYSAALAYYAIFSVAPLLLIAIFIVGLIYGQAGAQEQILAQVRQNVGEQAAGMVGKMIQQASKPSTGVIATVIGLVTLILGATRIFTQLKDILNRIWGVEAPGGVKGFLKGKLLAFVMVLLFGILFLALTIAATAATTIIHTLGSRLGNFPWLWQLGTQLLSVVVFTLLFAMIYKWLPDLKIPWSDVWVGSLVTAVLFTLGKYLLGIYLGRGSVASPYGAAGSLVVMLVFFYYSALIFFTGAEFTETYARSYGSRKAIGGSRPTPKAKAVEEAGKTAGATRPAVRAHPIGPPATAGRVVMGLAAFLAWRRIFAGKR